MDSTDFFFKLYGLYLKPWNTLFFYSFQQILHENFQQNNVVKIKLVKLIFCILNIIRLIADSVDNQNVFRIFLGYWFLLNNEFFKKKTNKETHHNEKKLRAKCHNYRFLDFKCLSCFSSHSHPNLLVSPLILILIYLLLLSFSS